MSLLLMHTKRRGENKTTRILLDKENEVDREKKPTDMDEENDDNLWRRRMEMKLTRRMDMIFDGYDVEVNGNDIDEKKGYDLEEKNYGVEENKGDIGAE